MEIEREKLEELRVWRQSDRRKPLIIRGARQVGKTHLVHRFGKEFPQYLYFNLERTDDKGVFTLKLSPGELITALFAQRNLPKDLENTLLFIDEIQQVPAAVQMLRYLYEDYPQLAVVAAGSLLEPLLGDHISFPVGRVEYLYIYPVTFAEYLKATNSSLFSLYHTVPLPEFAHSLLLNAFHKYVLVGGMPEVLDVFITDADLVKAQRIYEQQFTTYRDDIEKYARNETQRNVLRHLIRTAPLIAGQRVTFDRFGGSTYRSREVKEALLLLEDANLLTLQYPVSETTIPLLPNKRKSPYLYWMDTGVVNYLSGWQTSLLGITDLNTEYKGRITQHIVAQELRSRIDSPLKQVYFWTREKPTAQAEIDFVWQSGEEVIPIEVKSHAPGSLRSLHQFIDHAPHQMAVRMYAGPLLLQRVHTVNGKEFCLLNLPYFLAGKMDTYISWMRTHL